MQRHLAPLVVLLACGLLLPALASLTREPRMAAARAHALGAPRSDARACKPRPPLEVVLEQTAADGGVVTLAFAITPREDAGTLAWQLALPAGAELLDGMATGRLPAGSSGTGPLVARVRLPGDAPAARVTLEVDGELLEAAGATRGERIRERRTLTWGRPAAAVPPRSSNKGLGSPGGLALAPARHREGR